MSRVVLPLLMFSASLMWGTAALAQGLIWNIPNEEGRWIRYDGTYTQVMKRPNDASGDLTLNWTRQLTIKALGREDGTINGRSVPCRWIELKVETGSQENGRIDASSGAQRLYKILVPVDDIARVQLSSGNEVLDADRVLANYVRIAKGFRKIGEENVAPIESGVFQIYPVLSALQHYRGLTPAGNENVTLQGQSHAAEHFKAELITEDLVTRSTNAADLWKTQAAAVPFGLIKWRVVASIESKDATKSRDAFAPFAEITEEMAAAEVGTAAQSELPTP